MYYTPVLFDVFLLKWRYYIVQREKVAREEELTELNSMIQELDSLKQSWAEQEAKYLQVCVCYVLAITGLYFHIL